MGVRPIAFSLPYQGEVVQVDDVSTLMKLRFAERWTMRRAAQEVGSNLDHDLGHRVDLIHNTLTTQLPQAGQTGDILFACFQTALLCALVAGTVLSGLFLGFSALQLTIVLGTFSGGVGIANYLTASEHYVFPERRTHQNDPEPPGPWFCPNTATLSGKIAVASLVWPLLTGFVLPLLEVCTRKSRWEDVLATQHEQLGRSIPAVCEFYKRHGAELVAKLNEKIQAPAQERWSLDKKGDWEQALESVHAQIAFLRRFDPEVPDFGPSREGEQAI